MSNCVEEAIIKSESAAVDIKIEKPFLSTDDDITAESQLTDYLEIKSEQPELLFDVNCVKEEPSVDLGVDFINEQNNEEHLLENVESENFLKIENNNKSNSLRVDKFNSNMMLHCYYCKYSGRRSKLKKHMKKHLMDNCKLYRCHVCDYRTNRLDSLRVDMLTINGDVSFKCNVCYYDDNEELESDNEDRQFVCNVCDYETKRFDHLKNHMMNHSGIRPFKCTICYAEFKTRYDMKQHTILHSEKKPYNCKLCDYKCIRQVSFKLHMMDHTGERPYECNICNFRTKRNAYLKQHMASYHRAGDGKRYVCNECEYRTTYLSHLKRHQLIHTGTFNERSNDQNSKSDSLKKKIVKSAKNVKHRKLFTCYICNFRANRLNLKEHLKIHIEDGNDIQYKCHVCSYKASSNSLLRAHLYTHSDEKPHKCDECDYQAKYR
ncbi:hypothetical protein O3M35_002978 [Rhynocoris fuscipes]|uniref:C2H2-type domain-containing protein n=1 Tax=Rhynocoris fuscipes TaxID=488301 RepID=A0AAW1CIQ6_9HEMI